MIRANNYGATSLAAIRAGMRVYDGLPPALRLALRHCPIDTSATAVARRLDDLAAGGHDDRDATDETLLALHEAHVRAHGRSFLDDV